MKLGFHSATTMPSDLQAARLLLGLGVVPLDDICARLKGIGYDGPCSIELSRPHIGSGILSNWRSKRGRQPSTFCPPTLKIEE
jgi:sugar phosphate isomerase/epimerase